MKSQSRTDLRYRGLFKVNGYSARLELDAHWPDLAALQPRREHAASRLACGPVSVWIATSDVRGLRGATLSVDMPGDGDASNNTLVLEATP